MNEIIFTSETSEGKVTITVSAESSFSEITEMFMRFLHAAGFVVTNQDMIDFFTECAEND